MGGDEYGRALQVDLGEELDDLPRGVGVETAGRLVGQQQRRVVYNRAGDADALLFPTRQFEGHGVGPSAQADEFEHTHCARPQFFGWRPNHPQRKHDIFVSGPVGQQSSVLKHDPEPSPQQGHPSGPQAGDIALVHGDSPGGGKLVAIDQAQEGGLTRPRGADNKDKLPRLNPEGDAAEGSNAVRKDFCDVFKLDHTLLRRKGR